MSTYDFKKVDKKWLCCVRGKLNDGITNFAEPILLRQAAYALGFEEWQG